ncbi:MAG TPA: hypothetical protein VKV02_13910, partial [Acidobacteriaceae bacterium]|nr:hypothetical protein [Acidobacteriaceae bacterium]
MQLSLLPKPLPASLTQGIDVAQRSQDILAHLSEVIRFYRMATVAVQKTGEPSDMIYAEQTQAGAKQAAQLAFQSARDEAALLARIQVKPGVDPSASPATETQKLAAQQAKLAQWVQQLQAQDAALDKQIAGARSGARAALQQQKESTEGQLELAQAASEALTKVAGISNAQTNSGLQGRIDQLQHAVPELLDNKAKPVVATIDSSSVHESGVSGQAAALFQLLSTEHALDQRIQEANKLHDQALDLRSPLLNILRATLTAGQQLQSQPSSESSPKPSGTGAAASSADSLADTKKSYDELSDAFKTISGVSVPISEEVLLLEQTSANLQSWRSAVHSEASTIFRQLLLHVVLIALALLVIFGAGEVWRRATVRYVQDPRRRRQLLLVRRMVIGFLSGIVLILGFVSQFSSLATFAGFITAGIAVGLQTILLSVAAYFFIVGRYGVKVGDRITVAGVTGEVIEVGLARFYMMELAGTGTDL